MLYYLLATFTVKVHVSMFPSPSLATHVKGEVLEGTAPKYGEPEPTEMLTQRRSYPWPWAWEAIELRKEPGRPNCYHTPV